MGSEVLLWVLPAIGGWIWATVIEYVIHRWIFHGVGKKRSSIFSFHWHAHHKDSRKGKMLERCYIEREWAWNGYTREVAAMVFLATIHIPVLFLSPAFTFGVWAWCLAYHWVHRKTHVDPQWARDHCSWHYDHHMAPNQDANYGVTSDWMDRLMGTRERYAGTEKERKMLERRKTADAAS